MDNSKFSLVYLHLFYDDLENCVAYIADVLHNLDAANNLLDEVIPLENGKKVMEVRRILHNLQNRNELI